MAILNPDHLLDQAAGLIAPPPAGPPRQADIRRAISAAYYAVFHCVATTLADRYVGISRRSSAEYTLLYRSLDHKKLKDICSDLSKATPPKRYAAFIPPTGMSPNFLNFAQATVLLQDQRHMADYDPAPRLKTADAQTAIKIARSAVRRFGRINRPSRDAFLSLLTFLPRS